MCDIYTAKCKRRGCQRRIEMHVADFCIPRSSIDVFCGEHLPKRTGYNLFLVTESMDPDLKKGEKIGVRVRNKKHFRNDDICPNAMSKMKMFAR